MKNFLKLITGHEVPAVPKFATGSELQRPKKEKIFSFNFCSDAMSYLL